MKKVKVLLIRPSVKGLCLSLILGFFAMAFPTSVQSLSSLSENQLSEISGRSGLVADFDMPRGIEMGTVDYTDADGINGTSGTLRLDTVCLANSAVCGNSLNLSGFQLDSDGQITIDGTDRSGLVFHFPELGSDGGLSIADVYPGDPNASSVGNLSAIASSIKHTTLYLASNDGEGIAGKVDLDLHFNEFTYTDGDGNGTSGDFHVENIHVDDGSASAGNPATLDGFTVDSDGSLFSGSGGVLVGMPSGPVSVTTGPVYGGDPNGTPMVSRVEVKGLNLKNTSVEVGAN